MPDRAPAVRYEATRALRAPREDPALDEALERLRAKADVPEELWRAVEEVLGWAAGLDAGAG